jgi:hypothetical protein
LSLASILPALGLRLELYVDEEQFERVRHRPNIQPLQAHWRAS